MKTVTMTIEVTFDESVTDVDAVSCALDTLLETAMGTPGILDEYEYGPVLVGYFFPPDEAFHKEQDNV